MACQLNLSPYEQNRYARKYPCYEHQCETCGWNEEEHERRISRGLVTGSNGLRHFTITQEEIIADDTGN